ncbi:restriction endonuclease subunit S [Pasteurellaceae bacterium LIM206]|nr:restriction endonuclease subunit S [Pasteurellaceae bacterium LIM206]
MNFKPYSEYQPSGVEWLGDVPSHWEVKRFSHIFSEKKRKNMGLKETNVLSLSYGNIREKDINSEKGLLPETFETYQIVEPDDLIFRFTDLQNDKRSLRSAISRYKGIITSAYICVKNNNGNAHYFNYLFRDYDLKKVFYSMGNGMRQSLKIDELNLLPVAFPPLPEQTQIANFLDKQTACIDSLIAKQEQLITLLEEQKKSIISYAVTKGIEPNREMKESGVEWLGKVPSHWEMIKTKYIFNQRKENALFNDEVITAFRDGQVTLRKNRRVDGFTNALKEYGYQHIYKGDLVIHEMDAFAGAIGVSEENGKSTPVYTVLYPKKDNVNNQFYAYFFRTMALNGYISSLAKGIRVRSTDFRWSDSKNVHLVAPPLDEQDRIVAYIQTEQDKINQLIEKQKALINALKTYRTSLISYAVTGKIDVRDLG